MAEKARCEICDRTFKDAGGLAMHNSAKHSELESKEKKPLLSKKFKKWGIFIIVIGVVVFGIYWLVSNSLNVQKLPPTDMAGHIESSPSSHILKEPMDIRVQKHMLEHVDGQNGVGGGIIINYDCKNFECGSDLIGNLESFADRYNNVYVAPFKNMPVKIALTELGRIETFDDFDARKIETFITGIVPSG